jgi:methionine aminopeptidase
MSVETPEELEGLRRAGRAVAATLREVARRVRPGVTTAELDAVAARVLARHGARSGPALVYGFPGAICISVDDEAVHGIPGPRRLRAGELVKLDVTAELDGFYADAAISVAVGRVSSRVARLAAAAQAALRRGLEAALPYVGLVASRRRGAAVRESLDVAPALRAQIRTPAGLDLGARAPGERGDHFVASFAGVTVVVAMVRLKADTTETVALVGSVRL